MPGWKRLVAIGVVTLIAGLIVLFPARVAYRWFVPQDLKLSGISGTIWSGKASEGMAGGLYVNDLAWRFRPLALLTAKAAFSVAAEPPEGRVETDIAIRPGGNVSFSDFRAALPLASLGGGALLGGPGGKMTLQFDSFVIHDGLPIEADGTVTIANLVVPLMSPAPLGDYRAVFRTTDAGISGSIEDVSGILDLAGTIELRRDRSYLFEGQVEAQDGAPADIVRQLQFLGRPNAAGQHNFRFEGRL